VTVRINDFIIYNSVGFIEAMSNRMKRNYESKLKLNGYTTFSLRIKKPYVVNSPVIITTAEGVKFLLNNILTERDFKAISDSEGYYFKSQRGLTEYLTAISTSTGMITPMATRPTTLYLLSVAEKYGIRIPTNVHEHKPVLHIAPYTNVPEGLTSKAKKDYEAMFRGEDTGSVLTEFYFQSGRDYDLVVSRRLKSIKGDNVLFEDGNGEVMDVLRDKFGDKIAYGILRWVSMR